MKNVIISIVDLTDHHDTDTFLGMISSCGGREIVLGELRIYLAIRQ